MELTVDYLRGLSRGKVESKSISVVGDSVKLNKMTLIDDDLNLPTGELDRVKDIYEGGAKTWECTFDLIEYLSLHYSSLQNSRNNIRILELGCGSALVSCYLFALMQEESNPCAFEMYLQDYNPFVIELISYQNILLNCNNALTSDDYLRKHFKFFAGDWQALTPILVPASEGANSKFDLILGSELLYDIENYAKLLKLVQNTFTNNPVV